MKLENGTTSRCSNDGNRWIKCDSFEELPLQDTPEEKIMHKVCISTFVDKHVRTASVYDAVSVQKHHSKTPSFTSKSCNTNVQSTPKYGTSSLGTSTSAGKVIDVRRTPSLNVGPTSSSIGCNSLSKTQSSDSYIAQKPIRHYASNAQNHTSHGRTATRIGVSSLSRDQRLPLTLFSDHRILACGSEPNLYVPVNEVTPVSSVDSINGPKSQWHQLTLNSRSDMNLNLVENQAPFKTSMLPDYQHYNAKPRHLSLPDVCSDVVDGEFPCIPPPPAYRNEINGQKNVPGHSSSLFQLTFTSSERVSIWNF